ncbi:hypothetical protein BKA93DRAFT_753181 [Sparassis latifolia]
MRCLRPDLPASSARPQGISVGSHLRYPASAFWTGQFLQASFLYLPLVRHLLRPSCFSGAVPGGCQRGKFSSRCWYTHYHAATSPCRSMTLTDSQPATAASTNKRYNCVFDHTDMQTAAAGASLFKSVLPFPSCLEATAKYLDEEPSSSCWKPATACNSGVQPPPRGRGGPAKLHHTTSLHRRPSSSRAGPPRRTTVPRSSHRPPPLRLALPQTVERKRSAPRRRRAGHRGATAACSPLLAVAEAPRSLSPPPGTLPRPSSIVAPATAVQQRRAAPLLAVAEALRSLTTPHSTSLHPPSTLCFARRPATMNDGNSVATPASTLCLALLQAVERKRSAACLFSKVEGHASPLLAVASAPRSLATPHPTSPQPASALFDVLRQTTVNDGTTVVASAIAEERPR